MAAKGPRSKVKMSRDDWLSCDEATLLKGCTVDTYRASGPGGQKRNKTSSAVRLRHAPTGLIVIAEESRSQYENKTRALRRLRLAIALNVRQPVEPTAALPALMAEALCARPRLAVSSHNPVYPLLVAWVLDLLEAHEGRLRETAAALGVTTSQLTRFLRANGAVLAAANRCRERFGQPRIR
jgi:hypothetical protein